jgi:hypothetical protein
MNNLELGYHPLGENYGYLIDKAPQNVIDELKIQVDKLQNDFSIGYKANDTLAGEIEHEYQLLPPYKTKQYIKNLAQRFENESQYMSSNYSPIPTLKFKDLWVNFQKKHEYNPIHDHTGIYSFVIWYQIPYTFENEAKYHYSSDSRGKCYHGKFAFVIPHNSINKIENIISSRLDIDKSKQGYVAIFPSTLYHLVYPFYSSDEYRITVAGNIKPTT